MPKFGQGLPMASISIGATWVFRVLHRSQKPSPGVGPDVEIEIHDGAPMLGTFQHQYQHARKKAAASLGERLNLSFRRYAVPDSGAGRQTGSA